MRINISRKKVSMLAFAIFFTATAGCHDPVPPPEVVENTHPSHGYIVTVNSKYKLNSKYVIPDIYKVIAKYEIKNRNCIPLDYARAIGGVRLNYSQRIPLKSRRVSDGSVQAIVFDDKIMPKNYWGLGNCKWRISYVDFTFAYASPIDSIFISGDTIRGLANKVVWRCPNLSSISLGGNCMRLHGGPVPKDSYLYGYPGKLIEISSKEMQK